jgi:dTDP-4-amino-4,6-dideoxygalactose transaminase
MITFNQPYISKQESTNVLDALQSLHLSGDYDYTKQCQRLLEQHLGNNAKALLTTSCTHALEMAAILLDLQPGDEVIVPSYTFTSSALAFVMHGARIVFADIRPDTQNIDETLLESLITPKTRAIVVVHYAGVGCAMEKILDISHRHNIAIIEDNAHGLFGHYNGQALGTFGDLATLSFHETKNFTCGEGGALIVNNPDYLERAEIIREKGTNRSKFFRGQVDKYSWVGKGSSYVMSDMLAAVLLAQLGRADEIQKKRQIVWQRYHDALQEWATKNSVVLPHVPDNCSQAYHMFYMLMPSLDARSAFIDHLRQQEIMAVFHYLPLHESVMGKQIGVGHCPISSDISDRLVRLPFFTGLSDSQQTQVIDRILSFSR